MFPDLNISSIPDVLCTFHLWLRLGASGSYRAPGECSLSSIDPSHYFWIYTFAEMQIFFQLCHLIMLFSLPCIAWLLSGVACSLSAILFSHNMCLARFYVRFPR